MPRLCLVAADVGPNHLRAQLDSMGVRASTGFGRCAFGFTDDAGVARGPVTVGHLTAVGEVTLFNSDSLRRKLSDQVPPACSDLELLLHSYRRFGAAGIADADGMFAMVICDGDDLVLVRDHVGARTLFYARAQRFWAASTSLRELGGWPALASGLNLPAVASFLTFAYLPGAQTLFRGVYEVLPGRCVRLRSDGSVESETYWEPTDAVVDNDGRVDGAATARAVDELRRLLEEATSDGYRRASRSGCCCRAEWTAPW